MYKLLAMVTSLISLMTIAFFKGKKNQQQKEINANYENLKENTRINQDVKKEMDSADFATKSSKLRNKRKKNS